MIDIPLPTNAEIRRKIRAAYARDLPSPKILLRNEFFFITRGSLSKSAVSLSIIRIIVGNSNLRQQNKSKILKLFLSVFEFGTIIAAYAKEYHICRGTVVPQFYQQ